MAMLDGTPIDFSDNFGGPGQAIGHWAPVAKSQVTGSLINTVFFAALLSILNIPRDHSLRGRIIDEAIIVLWSLPNIWRTITLAKKYRAGEQQWVGPRAKSERQNLFALIAQKESQFRHKQ